MPSPRARVASDLVVAALGLNVWVSTVLLPGLFVGAFAHKRVMVLLAIVPLLGLAAGLLLRSAAILVIAYPGLLLFPIVKDERLTGGSVYGPVTFTLVAAGLVAYLLGACYATFAADPTEPERKRRLSSGLERVPPRWRRRMVVFAILAAFAVVTPLVLLYAVHFDTSNREFLRAMYPGRTGLMTQLADVGVLLLWLVLVATVFRPPFERHRTGDRDLVQRMEAMRTQARRGAPRARFYVAVGCALAFMVLLIGLRYR